MERDLLKLRKGGKTKNDERLLENDPVFTKLEELDDKDLYDEMLELINEIPRHRWNLELICTAASALNNSERFDEAERLLEEEKGFFITDQDKADGIISMVIPRSP